VTGLSLTPAEIHRAAEDFLRESRECEEMVGRLQRAVAEMRKKWESASGEVFYHEFQAWKRSMGPQAAVLKDIARQLDAIAERFAEADRG